MELGLGVVALLALVVALVALGLALGLRGSLFRLKEHVQQAQQAQQRLAAAQASPPPHEHDAAPPHQHHALEVDLAAVRRELDQVRRELNELKAATDTIPVPPLPRRRSSGLQDLRDQLRAAHREASEAGDSTDE